MALMKPADSSNVPPPAPVPITLGPLRKELWALAGAAGLTFLSNFLLWPALPGLSWGLFVVTLGVASALSPCSSWSRRLALLLTLLLLTACQSAVEISFSNVVVSLALIVAIVGEASYPGLLPGWERTSEALWALAKAPGRWLWANGVMARLEWMNNGLLGRGVKCLRVGLPALLLGIVFAVLLGQGNAIFGSWTSTVFKTLWRWLAELDLSIGHLLFYGLLATLSLWALRPSGPGKAKRLWARTIPELPVSNPAIALWRSVAILVVLNVLFFFVNTIDAFYLWAHGKLPAGVNASQFVHEGVHSLIAAVLLSAAVLAVLFQQGQSVGQNRLLKRLGYLWIAQNCILIAGVLLRLVRYIEEYLLTEQRVYAIAFVLLVVAGFALLALHIARGGSLNGLILSNALATLTLFFVLQFLNVAGWVANYNVAQWEHKRRDAGKALDIDYLARLGPPAWPALARVATSTPREVASEARQRLEASYTNEAERRATGNWRSWQARRAFNAAVLEDFKER